MAKRYFPFDPKTAFADGVTVSETGVVADAETPVVLTVGPGRHDAWLVVDVSAMSANESFRFILQGSDAADFDVSGEGEATKIVNLAMLDLGDAGGLFAGATDQGVGRYAVPVANEIKQQFEDCKYVHLYVAVTGGSVTFSASLSRAP